MHPPCRPTARPVLRRRLPGRLSGGWLALLPVLALLWAAGLAACLAPGLARAARVAPGGDAAVLYHNYCSVCHGDKGDGKSRAAGALSTMPRDFTSAASRGELSKARIATAITHGRPGTAMVAWQSQLSAADIERLTEHVYQRFVMGQPQAAASATGLAISGTQAHGGREADVAAPPVHTPTQVDMTAGLPNGLKGDIKRGGAFYLANCATCHGAQGNGAGPRAYFINPKPRNFVEEASRARLNRLALYAAISEGKLGTEMPAWSKVASAQQLGDVAEYVFQTFIAAKAAPPGQAQAAVRR